MNLRTFLKLAKEGFTRLHRPEWWTFLEVCEMYLKRRKIKIPIVVEVGMQEKRQGEFYEQLFGAEYISIDKLGKRTIDILSIGGGCYEEVKKNFEAYSPLCDGFIIIHDIECCRYNKRKVAESWKFWDELKSRRCEAAEKYKDSLFLSIYKRRKRGRQRGIGIIITK